MRRPSMHFVVVPGQGSMSGEQVREKVRVEGAIGQHIRSKCQLAFHS
jgi:hypothetical protein